MIKTNTGIGASPECRRRLPLYFGNHGERRWKEENERRKGREEMVAACYAVATRLWSEGKRKERKKNEDAERKREEEEK